jgi:hypothetical protein
MRYLFSPLFAVGLLLGVAAFALTPLFVTAGPIVVSGNPLRDSSWDIYQPTRWDFRIVMLLAVSGVALMVIGVVRMRRKKV